MKAPITIILCLFAITLAQKQRVAIMPTVADAEAKLTPSEQSLLMERLRTYASDVLPKSDFILLQQNYVIEKLGEEEFFKACKEGSCVGELIARVAADFGARCEVFVANNKQWLKFELYGTIKGEDYPETITTFTEAVKDFNAMVALIDKKVPAAFKEIIPVAPPAQAKAASSSVDEGVSNNVFTDKRDGKKYKIVRIGNQTWMAENLNYNASGSKCYENEPANCEEYGRLYDWSTALRACPSGWHLPSKNEYEALDRAVGGPKVAGKKLKTKSGWDSYEGKSGNGTDDYGFSALPGGFGIGISVASFSRVGYAGYWWSSDENDAILAYGRYMYCYIEYAGLYSYGKGGLLSVRCVKD